MTLWGLDAISRDVAFYALQQNASRVSAMARRLSVCVCVCVSVTLCSPIKTAQARITKSLLWAATKTRFFVTGFRAAGWRGFSQTRALKRDTP